MKLSPSSTILFAANICRLRGEATSVHLRLICSSDESRKLAAASWSYSCFSKGRGRSESDAAILSLTVPPSSGAFWSGLGSRWSRAQILPGAQRPIMFPSHMNLSWSALIMWNLKLEPCDLNVYEFRRAFGSSCVRSHASSPVPKLMMFSASISVTCDSRCLMKALPHGQDMLVFRMLLWFTGVDVA